MSHTAKKSEGHDIAATLGLGNELRKRPFWQRWYVWGTVVILLVVLILFWTLGRDSDGLQYKTAEVTRGDLVVNVTATGNLQPTNKVEVGSELSGIIETVEVDYNDRVKVGQVLARLDISKLRAQVLQSRAALEAARARVLQAQATVKVSLSDLERLQRVYALSGGKVPSPQEIDAGEAVLARARADEASARASVAQAEAILAENETDLGKAAILSPINGIVLVRSVEPGQTVAASLQAPVLFTLAEDLAQMELQVDVDEADVGHIQEGQQAQFTVDAYPDHSFPAHILQVRYGSEEVDGVVTYKAILGVDNTDLRLRPGMTATADIVVNRVEQALLVPNAALRFSPPAAEEKVAAGGGSLVGSLMPRPARSGKRNNDKESAAGKNAQVWVLRQGQPVAVPVVTGATDGLRTEIVGGELASGTAVIVDTVRLK